MSRTFPAKLFATCWLVYTLHWAPFVVREHFPAITLAEEGTLNVERFLGWTEDIFPGPRGGAFINNNPGASVAGAAPLFLARPFLHAVKRWNRTLPPAEVRAEFDSTPYRRAAKAQLELYFLSVAFLTVAGLMAPVSAFAATFLGVRAAQSGIPEGRAAAVAFIYAFGTPVFLRTEYLNHNLLAGQAGLIALLWLYDPKGRPLRPLPCFGAGLLGGYAVLCDYSGLLVLAAAAGYVLLRSANASPPDRIKLLAWCAAGAAPGLLGLLLYQFQAFGNPLLPSQHHMPAISLTSSGYRGFGWPSLALLWANFFDPRFGLFAFCPMLALAFAAPFIRGARYRVPPAETLLIFGYTAAFVLFCAANQYSWLQPRTGFRYLVPVVPGLLLLSLQVVQVLPPVIQMLVVFLTVLQNWTIAATQINHALPVLAASPAKGLGLSWLEYMRGLGRDPGGPFLPYALFLGAGALIYFVWRTGMVQSLARSGGNNRIQ